MTGASLSAERIVRAFASATNLVIAGQLAHVSGEGAAADSLRGLLRELGAVASCEDAADYVFLAPGSTGQSRLDECAARDGAIVVDCRDLALEVSAGAVELPTRPPLRRFRESVGRTVDVLRLDPSRWMHAGTHVECSRSGDDHDHADPHARAAHDADADADADADDASTHLHPTVTVVDGETVSEISPSLAPSDADLRLDWARRFMPASADVAERLRAEGVLRGRRFGVSMMLEPKTAVLSLLLAEAGARVALYAHADETDDAVAATLRSRGFVVHASSSAGDAEQLAQARAFLGEGNEFLLDDGSHLIRLAAIDGVPLRGAAEETTSGLAPLRAMGDELRIPVVSVNDARVKTGFDNRFGTGQSCVFAIADLLDGLGRGFADARVTVVGFGPVGVGIAQHAAALGALVTVSECDPVRALEARYGGYATAPLADAVRGSDIVISATGAERTITVEHLGSARAGAVFAVAGGVPHEIELDAALAFGASFRQVSRKVDELRLVRGSAQTAPAPGPAPTPGPAQDPGPSPSSSPSAETPPGSGPLILDRGGCINITAGEGNPVQIMDLSFAAQLTAAGMLARGDVRDPGLHPLPASADSSIAEAIVGPPVGAAGAGQHEFRRELPAFGAHFTSGLPDRQHGGAAVSGRPVHPDPLGRPAWHPSRFPTA